MSEQTDDLAGFWTSVVRAVTLIPAKVPLDWAHGRERTPRAPKWTSPGARGTFDEIKTPYYPPPGFYGGASVPEIERQKKLGKEVVFRADAAFAKPEIYEALEERGVKYAIRIPANDSLERGIPELLTRPVGRPSHKPVVWYKRFLYQAASWKTARRVVAKVEFYLGELFPRVGSS
jgi:hypothetical protein